ncbi:ATP-dependent DNA helicase PcrA [Clostridium argentinense CDC 2741]|uniref:ATP-dependent DNA helicase n=1 Tax=Clostridium argentinense CDC 2741 TaxID=1418104 RepID=A0A0C1QZH5_9CLOT|nr:DNA helicase PcrA [Clostridium argentinense]ARC85734.1 DNA helicase PcrA [Clostridium argentinense]KIE46507.1 ATP-dependent DNA helicase PcrA [Clostridium argentinense CDC 2741]NFF39813.1 DNA helicase PcrA [Clostridium argentinense]NFP51084.1 DNA helicase PcrA [Clostridium argentinense]NFP73216.1 DNA helicase PcrA [Clostridium argentinense]
MDLKQLLNKEQYEAAVCVDGPLLILAGAGSGKTRVLTYRIAHMIEDLHIYPSQILAITFTNKAAGEMKERVMTLVGEKAENMWISTFHSSCVRILRREIDKLGYNKNFTIYDSYDAKTLVKQCMKELSINEKDITDGEILGKISSAKNDLVSAEKFKKENESDFRKNKIADVYLLYQKKLKASNSLDFDDLIFKTVEVLRNYPDVKEFYQKKFKYIMVDEYQDTNRAQYELVKLLVNEMENICVVGDDDQCIYQWRGADIRNILDFEKDYPNTKIIKLEQNYRSKGNILNAANMVIKNNAQRKEKVLRTESELGEKLKVYRAFSDIDEGNFVASEIKRLMKEQSKDFKDFAILYRMNSQSRILEEAFRKQDIPYKIVGGLKFYDRKEIKDIMAYLKLINNPLDDISLRRIINEPKRSIGDTTVGKIQEVANEQEDCLYNTLLDADMIPNLTARAVTSINKFTSLINSFIARADDMPISELIMTILDESGYMAMLKNSNTTEDESRIENLKELVSDAVEFEKTSDDKSVAAFLEKVTLVSDIDNLEEKEETTVMMTVHSAKGLEFPVVFLVGMENGIFPGMSSLNSFHEMEESRRLCYVAITRAKENLYISSAETRMVFGRTVNYPVSDFVSEIPQSLKEVVGGEKARGVNTFKSKARASSAVNPHSLRGMEMQRITNSITKSATFIINGDEDSKTIDTTEATPGRKVKHTKFGVGTIISVSGTGEDMLLTIAFDQMGIKKLMLTKSPMEFL